MHPDLKIEITQPAVEKMIYCALCNAVGTGYIDGYGIVIDYDEAAYDKAKKKLKEFPTLLMDHSVLVEDLTICFEDILLQMLRDGEELKMLDEEEGNEQIGKMTLRSAMSSINSVPGRTISKFLSEQDDAEDGDVLLQYLFLGKLVYA